MVIQCFIGQVTHKTGVPTNQKVMKANAAVYGEIYLTVQQEKSVLLTKKYVFHLQAQAVHLLLCEWVVKLKSRNWRKIWKLN